MPTESIQIVCNTTSLLLSGARDVPVLAIPFGVIDFRLKELNALIQKDGTDEMKESMRFLGYEPEHEILPNQS